MEERTPGRRSFLLPGPTFSGSLKPGKVGFSFSYKLWTNARNGPPPGWAGWEAWVSGRRDRVGKNPAKTIFPKESFQIRVRTWCRKKQRPLGCGSIPKEGASEQRAVLNYPGAGQSPAILSPCFLIKKAGPPPGRHPPGALRPEAASEARPVGHVPPGAGPRPRVAVLRSLPLGVHPRQDQPPVSWAISSGDSLAPCSSQARMRPTAPATTNSRA